MSLLLGQLIYTSFPEIGFRVVTSAEVPREICHLFTEQIVEEYWSSYNPPDSDYRAVYLYQAAADKLLFGWLYNDGVDDFERVHVPYFICYYLTGLLESAQLDSIFTCLATGPVELIERSQRPDRLESLMVSEHERYQAARPGVAIASQIQDQSRLAVQRGKLFKLFLAEEISVQSLNFVVGIAPSPLKALVPARGRSRAGRKRSRVASATANGSELEASNLEPSEEAYRQFLRRARTERQTAAYPRPWKPFIKVGIPILIALILGGAYLLREQLVPALLPSSSGSNKNVATAYSESPILAKTFLDTAPVWSVALNSSGKTVISGGANQKIKVWNLETGTLITTLTGHADVVRSLALAPDSKTLISGSGDSTIKLWDLPSSQLIQTLNQESPVWSVAVSRDQKILVSGSDNGSFKVWHLPDGELKYTVPAHESRIFAVAISPDNKTIATASLDHTIKLWSVQTGVLLRTLVGHKDAVWTLTFSPDGQTLASASWDKTLKLWNWQNGELIRTFAGHRAGVVAVAFKPDGKTLISGSIDRTIDLWTVQDGKLQYSLTDHPDWVLSLATDAERFVSSSKDQTIRVWQFR